MPARTVQRTLLRRPLLLLGSLLLLTGGAWQLGSLVPHAQQPGFLRTAIVLDLFVVVPLMMMLYMKVWRSSMALRVEADQELPY